jgi:hypothetical protein
MQKLEVDTDEDPVTPETLLVLQLRAANQPFLPGLKSFKCRNVTETFIPFISFFLSPQVTEIDVAFARNSPTLMVAPAFGMFPTLCPNLESVAVVPHERNPVIIDAVSEMLLACNPDSLRFFCVGSPLTEGAREVVYRLPKLSHLWAVIEGHSTLPLVVLPALISILIEYDDHLDWLQGFRGATLGGLESVSVRSDSNQIGDFLGAFESVMFTTSTQNTLLHFSFYTLSSWNPNYYSLLSFKRLKLLNIEFGCGGGCSSRVDDDVITALAQAMPDLEILQLGRTPCATPTGATVHGLIDLASRCPHLSKLRIHFQGDSLVATATSAATSFIPTDEPVVLWEDCALTDLEVGGIPIPADSTTRITQMLLRIFPHIIKVEYTNPMWKGVAEYIKDFGQIGAFVRRAGKVHPVTSNDS